MPRSLLLSLLLPLGAAADEGLLHQWTLTAENIKDRTITPLAGPLEATIIGPVRVNAEAPRALLLDGNSRAKHRIDVTADLAKAKLPARSISVEAWVRVDQPLEWGSFACAVQHNGAYQKGWVLGFRQDRFSFAVAGKGNNKLTYLTARTSFQAGFWYHVLGTYDGTEQRVYVDGRLHATSREQSGDIDYPARVFYTLGAFRDDDELYTTKGCLESVSVFSKALTAEQVAARFRERKHLFPDIDEVRPSVNDWPTEMRDNQRTGVAAENLKLPLRLAWVHRARHAPRPAWNEEAKADYFHDKYAIEERITFDRAFHVVGVGDQIYFASSADDRVRCLDLNTGRTLWTFATEGPVRLAPTLVDERVLFGSDDGFVYCLAARDGGLLWKQRIGPSGRRIPGNERIISAWPIRTDTFVEEGKVHVCAGVFPSQGVYQATLDLKDGRVLDSRKLGVTAQGYLERRGGQLHVSTGRNPAGAFVARLKRLGKEAGKEVNNIATDYPYAFIGAGDLRIAGGDGKLAAFRVSDGARVWSAAVDGSVFSLAVVRGRLLASTDRGLVYCFSADAGDMRKLEPAAATFADYPDDVTRKRYESTADAIVKRADLSRGYCLVLGAADGRLMLELARRTQWHIVGVEPDESRVARARKLLDDAGLADRAVVHRGPVETLPCTDYLFNVIVSDSLATPGRFTASRQEALRVLRPEGGMAFFGLQDREIVCRSRLEGAGSWTHMYSDPANTACSGDRLVTGEMQLQWFGKPGPRAMIDRHHRTSAPLYHNGRLFVPAEDRVIGVDAYNGTVLWDTTVTNSRRVAAFRDSGHLVVADEALYVAAADCCLALDPRSGKVLRTHRLPDAVKNLEWGYTARAGDWLIGTGVKRGSIRREQSHKLTVTETHWDFVPTVGSDVLFARNPEAERPAWVYRPGGLILNTTVALADGRVYFIESGDAETLKLPTGRVRLQEMLGKGSKLVALDLKTGKPMWSKPGDVFTPLQHNVFTATAKGCLVVVGSRNSGADRERSTLLYDVHVFDAATGERKWSKTQDQKQKIGGDHGEQERHPVIVGDRLYCEPFAYELTTGKPIEWHWPWALKARRGCGTLSASASCFYFRDDTVKLFDLAEGKPANVTAETRPGCWINLLPAGGLLLAPEASSGCTCTHSVQTSLALIPIKGR